MTGDTRCDDDALLPEGWVLLDDQERHPEAYIPGEPGSAPQRRVQAYRNVLLVQTQPGKRQMVEVPSDVVRAVLEHVSTRRRPSSLPRRWRWVSGSAQRHPPFATLSADCLSVAGDEIVVTWTDPKKESRSTLLNMKVARTMLARFGGGETVTDWPPAESYARGLPEGWTWTDSGARRADDFVEAYDGRIEVVSDGERPGIASAPLEVVRAVLARFGER